MQGKVMFKDYIEGNGISDNHSCVAYMDILQTVERDVLFSETLRSGDSHKLLHFLVILHTMWMELKVGGMKGDPFPARFHIVKMLEDKGYSMFFKDHPLKGLNHSAPTKSLVRRDISEFVQSRRFKMVSRDNAVKLMIGFLMVSFSWRYTDRSWFNPSAQLLIDDLGYVIKAIGNHRTLLKGCKLPLAAFMYRH